MFFNVLSFMMLFFFFWSYRFIFANLGFGSGDKSFLLARTFIVLVTSTESM